MADTLSPLTLQRRAKLLLWLARYANHWDFDELGRLCGQLDAAGFYVADTTCLTLRFPRALHEWPRDPRMVHLFAVALCVHQRRWQDCDNNEGNAGGGSGGGRGGGSGGSDTDNYNDETTPTQPSPMFAAFCHKLRQPFLRSRAPDYLYAYEIEPGDPRYASFKAMQERDMNKHLEETSLVAAAISAMASESDDVEPTQPAVMTTMAATASLRQLSTSSASPPLPPLPLPPPSSSPPPPPSWLSLSRGPHQRLAHGLSPQWNVDVRGTTGINFYMPLDEVKTGIDDSATIALPVSFDRLVRCVEARVSTPLSRITHSTWNADLSHLVVEYVLGLVYFAGRGINHNSNSEHAPRLSMRTWSDADNEDELLFGSATADLDPLLCD